MPSLHDQLRLHRTLNRLTGDWTAGVVVSRMDAHDTSLTSMMWLWVWAPRWKSEFVNQEREELTRGGLENGYGMTQGRVGRETGCHVGLSIWYKSLTRGTLICKTDIHVSHKLFESWLHFVFRQSVAIGVFFVPFCHILLWPCLQYRYFRRYD